MIDNRMICRSSRRLGDRIRTEILTRLRKPKNADDVERVERVLKRIEREALDEGFRDRSMLTQLFESPEIERMYDEWEQDYRSPQGRVAGQGVRDQGLRPAASGSAGVKTMNREFTIVAVRRYSEMLTDDA